MCNNIATKNESRHIRAPEPIQDATTMTAASISPPTYTLTAYVSAVRIVILRFKEIKYSRKWKSHINTDPCRLLPSLSLTITLTF